MSLPGSHRTATGGAGAEAGGVAAVVALVMPVAVAGEPGEFSRGSPAPVRQR